MELCINSIRFVILEYIGVSSVLSAAEVQQLFHNVVYKQLCTTRERSGNHKKKSCLYFQDPLIAM